MPPRQRECIAVELRAAGISFCSAEGKWFCAGGQLSSVILLVLFGTLRARCGVVANPRARLCVQNLRDGRDTPNTRAAAQWLAQMGAPVEDADAGACARARE